MTALERAARALADAESDRMQGTFYPSGQKLFERTPGRYYELARAVLMAVRDFDGDVYVGPNLIEDHECGPIFASVIDAILNEKE